MITNPGFSDWIAAKYNVYGQKHRRFPTLTFLVIKHPHASQSLLIKNITMLRNNIFNYYNTHYNTHYSKYYSKYCSNNYLRQTLLFNINLFSRFAGKSRLIMHHLLKSVEALNPILQKEQGNIPAGNRIEFSHPVFSTVLRSVREQINQWKAILLTGPPPPMEERNGVSPAVGNLQAQGLPHLFSFLNHSQTFSPRGPGSRETLEKGEPVQRGYPSIAVTKPMRSITKTTFPHISKNIKTNSLFFPRSIKHTLIPETADNPESQALDFHTTVPGPKTSPSLTYSNLVRVALEDIKKTVVNVEKKVKDEIVRVQETHPVDGAVSHNSSGMSSKTDIDIHQLTDHVYRMLEKKIRIEKERRGW